MAYNLEVWKNNEEVLGALGRRHTRVCVCVCVNWIDYRAALPRIFIAIRYRPTHRCVWVSGPVLDDMCTTRSLEKEYQDRYLYDIVDMENKSIASHL